MRARRGIALATAGLTAALALTGCTTGAADEEGKLTVYIGRDEELVAPLIEQFEEETGIEVEARYAATPELTALLLEEGERTPAQVFLSQDAGALGALADAGLEATIPAELLTGTVLFGDLRGFTAFAEALPASRVIEVLNLYLGLMTDAILDHGGTLVDYMGDGVEAAFGAPVPSEDHADRALAAARVMVREQLPAFNAWLAQ